MAIPAEHTLRRLLAEFQVVALLQRTPEQRLGQEVHSASNYETKLQNAALITPLAVVQHEAQLQAVPHLTLSTTELQCLKDAAYSLTGLVPC